MDKVTVETTVYAPIEKVWNYYNEPAHITAWAAGSPDWHTPRAENDLRVGGTFNTRMESKDGTEGFDFTGTYDEVVPHKQIAYTMDGGRKVVVSFAADDDAVKVTAAFDPENENPVELQRSGWQAILDNFKKHVESH